MGLCAQELSGCPVGVRSLAVPNTSRDSGASPRSSIFEDTELIIREGREALLATAACVCSAAGV